MQYFDKAFFKFTVGFLGIISVSLLVIVVTTLYSDRPSQAANAENTQAQASQ